MQRSFYSDKISSLLRSHAVVAILGPRQIGKSTLAQLFSKHQNKTYYFDLEDPRQLNVLETPMAALENLTGLIIIDEVQRRPDLFPAIRVLVDRAKGKLKFLILGSASRELIQQSSETLAGRIAYFELNPFSIIEIQDVKKLWLRGGYPKSFLARSIQDSLNWRRYYIRNFIEQDIPSLGIDISTQVMRRLWNMLAHYNANTINYSDLARSLGRSPNSIKHYIDILTQSLVLQQLQPWHENISKRQVKSPKIYFKDTGLLHSMLGITSWNDLLGHPQLGASWEAFALRQIMILEDVEPEDCYFWSTVQEAELDLLILKNGKRLGYEFKFSESPSITKSMRIALADLKLDSLKIVCPSPHSYSIEKKISVLGINFTQGFSPNLKQ